MSDPFFAGTIEVVRGRLSDERAGQLVHFWTSQGALDEAASSESPAMIRAAFGAREEEFDPAAGGPIGLCLMIADPAEMKRRPEAAWTDPRILCAGYLADGRQVRIGYFAGATI